MLERPGDQLFVSWSPGSFFAQCASNSAWPKRQIKKAADRSLRVLVRVILLFRLADNAAGATALARVFAGAAGVALAPLGILFVKWVAFDLVDLRLCSSFRV